MPFQLGEEFFHDGGTHAADVPKVSRSPLVQRVERTPILELPQSQEFFDVALRVRAPDYWRNEELEESFCF